MEKKLCDTLELFQSALPRGERQISINSSPCHRDFNPRSREGSDTRYSRTVSVFRYFNPRSREGSDTAYKVLSYRCWDFNPRSREGSDAWVLRDVFGTTISIRAPARGATKSIHQHSRPARISIRAPARGATGFEIHSSEVSNDFNPRSREGSDVFVLRYKNNFIDFNPRSREGSDIACSLSWVSSRLFQSALPRGERLNSMIPSESLS